MLDPCCLAQRNARVSRHIAGPRRRLRVELRPLDPEVATLAAQAVALADQGGTVAVIVDTVQRAQDLFVAVRGRLGDRFQSMHRACRHPQLVGVHLYHARYPADERAHLDQQLRKASSRCCKPIALTPG